MDDGIGDLGLLHGLYGLEDDSERCPVHNVGAVGAQDVGEAGDFDVGVLGLVGVAVAGRVGPQLLEFVGAEFDGIRGLGVGGQGAGRLAGAARCSRAGERGRPVSSVNSAAAVCRGSPGLALDPPGTSRM